MVRKIADFIGYQLSEEQIQAKSFFFKANLGWLANFCFRNWMSTWNLTTFKRLARQTRKAPTGIKTTKKVLNADQNWRFEGKGQFIRKGIVGDWVNHFSPQLNKVGYFLSEKLISIPCFLENPSVLFPAIEKCENLFWRRPGLILARVEIRRKF